MQLSIVTFIFFKFYFVSPLFASKWWWS